MGTILKEKTEVRGLTIKEGGRGEAYEHVDAEEERGRSEELGVRQVLDGRVICERILDA